MNQPNNYSSTTVGAEQITPGGHKCIIKQVEETKSQSGKDMLIVSFDTTNDDTQPGYYMNRWINDTRDEKKWQGRMFIVTEGEYGTSNLKRFTTSVERSNEGMDGYYDDAGHWGKNFAASFKDKQVGVVFRREEYTTDDHQSRWSTKPFRFCSYDAAFDQAIPKEKPHPDSVMQTPTPAPMPQNAPSWAQQAMQTPSDGFMDIPEGSDEAEGLPFN